MADSKWLDKYRQRVTARTTAKIPKTPFSRRPENTLRGVGIGQQGSSGADLLSTQTSYDYLLGSLRINAPGYSLQDAYSLSQQFTGIVYLAINCKTTQAGVADVSLFEMGDDPEERLPLSRYESVSRFFDAPNPEDTLGEIIEQICLQYSLTGTALVWLPREGNDPPEEMYCLSTASVLPQPISARYPKGAYLVQPWFPAGPYAQIPVSQGIGSIIPAEQIVRIKTPNPFFRWIGYSTLFATSLQIDTSRQIDLSRSNAMFQGLDPSGILSFDPAVKQPSDADLRRLEAQVQNLWAGPKNVGKLIVAPAGAEFSPFANKPNDMAYQEGWMQLLDFTMAANGMNKGVAGMTDGITYATLFASLRAFYLMSLNPFLARVSAKLTTCLIHKYFSPHFGMELTGKSITDESLLKQKADTLIKGKAITKDELRKLYDMPPMAKDGDKIAGESDQPGMPGAGDSQLGGNAAPEAPEDQDRETENSRPENPDSSGGPSKAFFDRMQKMMQNPKKERRIQRLMGVLEKHMSNGSIGYTQRGRKS